MKKRKDNLNIALSNLKPLSGGVLFNIQSDRHGSSVTISVNYYKPISKFKIIQNE